MNTSAKFLVSGWVLDTLCTSVFTSLGGTELEANPLMRTVLEWPYGLLWFVLFKAGAIALYLVVVDRIWPIVTALLAIVTWTAGILGFVLCVSLVFA